MDTTSRDYSHEFSLLSASPATCFDCLIKILPTVPAPRGSFPASSLWVPLTLACCSPEDQISLKQPKVNHNFYIWFLDLHITDLIRGENSHTHEQPPPLGCWSLLRPNNHVPHLLFRRPLDDLQPETTRLSRRLSRLFLSCLVVHSICKEILTKPSFHCFYINPPWQ